MTADLASLLDRLGAASLDARDQLAQLRGAMRDARAVIKELDDARERWQQTVRTTLDERIAAELAPLIAEMADTIGDHQHRLLAQVTEAFTAQANVVLFGNEQGRGSSVFTQFEERLAEAVQVFNRRQDVITIEVSGDIAPAGPFKFSLPPEPVFPPRHAT